MPELEKSSSKILENMEYFRKINQQGALHSIYLLSIQEISAQKAIIRNHNRTTKSLKFKILIFKRF